MHLLTVAPLESVGIDEREEQLEVRLFPVVRSGGEQEEVPGESREKLPKLMALGVLDFIAEDVRRHLVGLVNHN